MTETSSGARKIKRLLISLADANKGLGSRSYLSRQIRSELRALGHRGGLRALR
jgi:hypothetical protein